jgi:preprotein translocase subunit SecD
MESELRARLQILQAAKVQRESLKNSGDQKAIAENETTYKKSIEDLKSIFESTGLTGNMLKDAVASTLDRSSGVWQIALTFDAQGSDLFAKITGEIGGTGRTLGIFLDDQLISFPSVGSEFQGKGITGGRAVIIGNFTSDSANELALQIRSGALPIPLEIIDSRSF